MGKLKPGLGAFYTCQPENRSRIFYTYQGRQGSPSAVNNKYFKALLIAEDIYVSTRPRRFLTFYISVLEIFLLTYLLTRVHGHLGMDNNKNSDSVNGQIEWQISR